MSRRLSAVAVLTALLLPAGCGDDGSDLPPPASSPPTGSPTPELQLTPAEQQAVDEARAVFDEFMQTYIEVARTNEIHEVVEGQRLLGGRVLQHLASPLRREVQQEISDNWQNDRVMDGSVEWTFLGVVEVDLEQVVRDQVVPRITARYCIDATRWLLVDENTGEPVGDPGVRQNATVTFVYAARGTDPEPTWLVGGLERAEAGSC